MTMLLDVLTVIVIALFAVSSYQKGFLYSIAVLAGSLGALYVAITYSQPIARLIYDNYLYDKVAEMAAQHLEQFSASDMQAFAQGMQGIAQELPAFLSTAFESQLGLNLNEWYRQMLQSNSATVTAAILDSVVAPIVIALVRVVVFSIIFGVLMAIVNALASLLRGVKYIPLIGPLNGILGGVLGAIQGMLYVFVISAVLWFVLSASGGAIGPLSNTVIAHTAVFKYFYLAGPWVDSTIKLI